MEQEKFDTWAIVELLGHTVIAGKVTEQNLFGTQVLRVDVPELDGKPAFTKFYGNHALYCVTPCSEEVARAVQSYRGVKPINVYVPDLPQLPRPYADAEDNQEGRDDDEVRMMIAADDRMDELEEEMEGEEADDDDEPGPELYPHAERPDRERYR